MLKIFGFVIARGNEVVPAATLENMRTKLWIETQKIASDRKLVFEFRMNLSAITAIDAILFSTHLITKSCSEQRIQEIQRLDDMWVSQANLRIKQEEADDNG